ncbi:MAG: triose-phosphate isomerase [Bacteroidetes bacterium]|nr:triose-phosphate isomerase [Bacteroidota bacterium]
MRKKIIAANWKMNKTYGEALMLATEVAAIVSKEHHPSLLTVLAPPFPFLTAVSRAVDGTEGIMIAAQNCHHETSGAFTGEVSVPMIISCGAHFVIIGHSERRMKFGETNDLLYSKMKIALGSGLRPILCVGESESERNSGKHFDVISEQLRSTLFHFDDVLVRHAAIAYEPVWAIGTGKNATAEQTQEMHAFIRKTLGENFGAPVAGTISILYGGSCNASNAKELFSCADVDGGLIGGASLDAEEFSTIRKAMLELL